MLGLRNEEDDRADRRDAYRLNREAFDTKNETKNGASEHPAREQITETANDNSSNETGDLDDGSADAVTPKLFSAPIDDTPIQTGRGLSLVRENDPDFDEATFVEGARQIYEMILLDFAAGDLSGVKQFLGPDVLAGFEAAIDQRAAAGEHLVTEIHSLARPAIEDAEYDNGTVRLSVRYSAELISHVSQANEADEKPAPVRSRDLWTFERHVNSDSPNWLLVATETE